MSPHAHGVLFSELSRDDKAGGGPFGKGARFQNFEAKFADQHLKLPRCQESHVRCLSEHLQNTQIIQDKYAECAIADYYRASTKEYALSFGNDFVDDRFSDPLQQIYPNSLVYEKWERNYHRFGTILSATELDDILSTRCLILRGSPMDGTFFESLSMTVLPANVGKFEAIYVVEADGLSE